MPPLLDAVPTRYLSLEDYIADYNTVSDGLDGDIWKSERAQYFREPGDPSWEALPPAGGATPLRRPRKPSRN